MKVRANSLYVYRPVALDDLDPHATAVAGETVRVINLPGAPKANTMGQCHIERASNGEFLGMVCCNSLVPAKRR